MRRLSLLILAVIAVSLSSCGDSGGDEEVGRTQPGTAQESGATGNGGGQEKGKSSNESDVPPVQLDEDQQPVPEGSVLPKDRSGKPPGYSGQRQIPKEQLKAIERPVYEQTRYLCRRLGIDGMRREYRIDGSDPEDVARAVAARTYQREIRDAVYSGCLAGLRAG